MKNIRSVLLLLPGFTLGLTLAFGTCRAADNPPGKEAWWLRDGACFVGNWEPLSFRIRNGRVPRDYRAHYEYEHRESTVEALKAAGVNMVITHFYKGLGLEHEQEDLAYTRKLAGYLKKHGMYAGAYIGSTLFSETLYGEVPGSEDWVQRDHRGEPIHYGDQYFRERADFTHPGYREQIKKAVSLAVTEYGMDLIHFDNFYTMFPLDAGYTERIQNLFRGYLGKKYTPQERKERLGFADLEHLRPPRVANRPMDPVEDPLVQEWIGFRVEALSDFIQDLSRHIRSLNPETAVEFNPHGLWGQNSAYSNGMDHARLLPWSDFFWSEDPDHAAYFPDQNRLVSKIRSYKLARRFGNALFSYNFSPLELAEALAFNRMCLGDVAWPVIEQEDGKPVDRAFIRFFNEHRELYRGLEEILDVGVMRDFESMTFGGWKPFLNTIQAEQSLIQSRLPFSLLFDNDWKNLSACKVVVLAAQECLSDEEIGELKKYLEAGGSMAVVGRSTGAYDTRRRARDGADSFWRLLGLESRLNDPGRPARMTLGKGRVFYLPEFENHPDVPASANEVHPDYWYLPLNWEEFLAGLAYCRGGDYSAAVEARPWVAAQYYRKNSSLQAHLVNYRKEQTVRGITVAFNGTALNPGRASLLSPEHAPLTLELIKDRQGWRVVIPELKTYGVVVLE